LLHNIGTIIAYNLIATLLILLEELIMKLNKLLTLTAGAALSASVAGTSFAVQFVGTPSSPLSPIFGTLIDFDDQATGTVVGANDYAALGLASITETTGSGAAFARYAGTQSSPNYIGTGVNYEIGGSGNLGWDGKFLFEFSGLASMVGIGVADSRGDAEIINAYDSSFALLESWTVPTGTNVYTGIDRGGVYDIKYFEVVCDFCALDDLQFKAVPEPGTLALLGLGLLGFVGMRRFTA
jgi:hypothetical protein